jgi:cell division protein FtsQ
MDDRGRLAQPLTRTDPRGSVSFGRWRRIVRRIVSPIIELNPPRGAGSVAVLALMTASAGYGVVQGGHAPALAAQWQDICDYTANGAGFRIATVALAGQAQLRREDILAVAGIGTGSSLLCLDAADARARLIADPWISEAKVQKFYPGRLRIEVAERRPVALWQNHGVVNVIAVDATVLEPYNGTRFTALPLVVGDGADREAKQFLDTLARTPAIGAAVKASVLVARRRWNLHLHQGIEVRLPETDAGPALQRLAELDRDKKLLSRDITMIDLRLPDRITVRLSDAAAQARSDAVNAALKDKKPKRKGNDA